LPFKKYIKIVGQGASKKDKHSLFKHDIYHIASAKFESFTNTYNSRKNGF